MFRAFKNSRVASFASIRDLEGLQNIFQSDNKLNRTILGWFKPEQILDQAGGVRRRLEISGSVGYRWHIVRQVSIWVMGGSRTQSWFKLVRI